MGMQATGKHEPTAEHLKLLGESIQVSLVSFEQALVRISPSDFLPRYNRIVAGAVRTAKAGKEVSRESRRFDPPGLEG